MKKEKTEQQIENLQFPTNQDTDKRMIVIRGCWVPSLLRRTGLKKNWRWLIKESVTEVGYGTHINWCEVEGCSGVS